MGFTNIFGGGTVQAGDVAYRQATLTANLTLAWPEFSRTTTDYAARVMDVAANVVGLVLALPPANQVSPGMDLLIAGRGTQTFTITDNAGNVLCTVAPGASKYLILTDNSTVAGAWSVTLFGAISSGLDAATVAGLGLAVSGATLIQSEPVTSFSADYTVAPSDRARVYVWTGGAGTLTLPTTNTPGIGTDFAFEIRNNGTGILTVAASGGNTVDSGASITLQPTESARFHSGDTAWYTVGRGRSTQFAFTLLVKSITGGTVTLTSTEAANVVQRYSGVLVSNATIVLPSVVQVYYVSNQTSGAFSVTFKCGGGTTVTVPTNQNAVLFCDGTNTINTSTTVAGLSSLSLAQGTVSAPSINYSGDATTGLYQPSGGSVAVAITGVQRALVNASGVSITGALAVSGAAAFGGVVTGVTPTLAAHLTTKAYVDGLIAGGGYLPLSGGAGSPLSGTIYSSPAEALRVNNTGGFISAYNTAGASRTGYIQFNNGGAVIYAAEAATSQQWNVNGLVLMTLGAANLNVVNTVVAGGFSGPLTGNVTGNLTGNVTGNVSGSAGSAATASSIGGLTPSAVAGVASRIVAADASGYIANTYFNSTDNSQASGVTGVMVKVGDNFLRTGTAQAIATFLSGATMNINGNATSASSATSATTAGTVSNASSNGYGTRTVQAGGSPSGGIDGDIVYIY